VHGQKAFVAETLLSSRPCPGSRIPATSGSAAPIAASPPTKSYAVDVLKVEHVIVCGHYGCGGVQASLERRNVGLVDNWLRHVRDVHHKHAIVVESVLGPAKLDTLCELNVIEQAANVCHSTVMQDAWARGQKVEVHAWIYGLRDGLIKDLGLNVASLEALTPAYGKVLAHYRRLGGTAG